MKNGYKEMKNAEVWVQVVTQEYIDEFGQKRRIVKWQKLDAPVSLGSMKHPKNQQIIGFKVVNTEPDGNIDIKSFFDSFGGFFK